MKNIVISIFNNEFVNYALKMYNSYRFFDKTTPLYAGSLNLSSENIKKIESIGVKILKSKTDFIPKNLCVCDLILKDFVEDLNYDSIMWIDADTVILRPINYIFNLPYDFIGHGGDVETGKFFFKRKRSWLFRETINDNLIEKNKWGNHYAMGLWVAKNKKIINDFYDLIIEKKDLWYEGDVCSELINKKYSNFQLNGFEWSLGTRQIKDIFYKNNKVFYKTNNKLYMPYQFGYSRLDNGERPICKAIESFYKNKKLRML
jgi:hypothetical protein